VFVFGVCVVSVLLWLCTCALGMSLLSGFFCNGLPVRRQICWASAVWFKLTP